MSETADTMPALDSLIGAVIIVAIVPGLRTGDGASLVGVLAEAGVIFLVKAVASGASCLIFARYGECLIAKFIKTASRPGPILLVIGISIPIAGVAGLLGFSLAIGAPFADLLEVPGGRTPHH